MIRIKELWEFCCDMVERFLLTEGDAEVRVGKKKGEGKETTRQDRPTNVRESVTGGKK